MVYLLLLGLPAARETIAVVSVVVGMGVDGWFNFDVKDNGEVFVLCDLSNTLMCIVFDSLWVDTLRRCPNRR